MIYIQIFVNYFFMFSFVYKFAVCKKYVQTENTYLN